MYAQLLIGPVARRPEGEEAWVLHAPKGGFHMGLAAVGAYDLFVAPVLPIGKEDRLPEQCTIKFLPFPLFEASSQPGDLILVHSDVSGKKVFYVVFCDDVLNAVVGSL